MLQTYYLRSIITAIALSSFVIIFGASTASSITLDEALLTTENDGNNEQVHKLRNVGTDISYTDTAASIALLRAARAGNLKTIEMLLKTGACINHTNRVNDTALIKAASSKNHPCIKALLRAGADVNHANIFGYHALMVAALLGPPKIVTTLLYAGADIHHANNVGDTALIQAMNSGNKETVEILLRAGSTPLSNKKLLFLWRKDRKISPIIMLKMQAQISQERREALGQWAKQIDTEYNIPRDLQRYIIRDILGTAPEQLPEFKKR